MPSKSHCAILAAIAIAGCSPQDRDEPDASVSATPAADPAADAPAPTDLGLSAPATTPVPQETPDIAAPPGEEPKTVNTMRADPGDAPAGTPYIARLRQPVAVVNIANPGRLSVRNGCLVVEVGGQTHTAVFNGPASISGSAVRFEGKSLPLDRTTPIPGGRLNPSDFALRAPAPSGCPSSYFGIGG